MDIRYFTDTDTLLIDFADKDIIETKDVTENIIVELDKNGVLVSMTIEHANDHIDIGSFSYVKMAAATP